MTFAADWMLKANYLSIPAWFLGPLLQAGLGTCPFQHRGTACAWMQHGEGVCMHVPFVRLCMCVCAVCVIVHLCVFVSAVCLYAC